jgi:hypothetical protein
MDMAAVIAFFEARLAEKEAPAHFSGPAKVAWLTYLDDQGQMLYTTVAAGDDDQPWCADGHELPAPASASVVYDPGDRAALHEVGQRDGRVPPMPSSRRVRSWPGSSSRNSVQLGAATRITRRN